MMKYVLQRLGYGHLVVEKNIDPPERGFGFHSTAPNTAILDSINNSIKVDFNPHEAVSDLLPFTPLEYILGGVFWALHERDITGDLGYVGPAGKFTTKTLISIPSSPMSHLELINIIQNSMKYVNALPKYKMYVTLSNDDVLLNAITSQNFNKTAMTLSIPVDVMCNINSISLTCDSIGSHYYGHYFTYKFKRTDDRWLFSGITTTKLWEIVTPLELLMYIWTILLSDLDHICNRTVVLGGMPNKHTDVNYHYNLRSKYDLTIPLVRIVKIIDSEIQRDNRDLTLLQTIIMDHSINLSSNITDFKYALDILKSTGSKRVS